MGADIDKSSVERAYARWAPVYDLVFGAVFDAGRRASIEAAEQACGPAGGRILEVGVGTGISLPEYARKNRLVGIDLSEPMLRRAHERVAEYRLTNVEALAVMDAERMALPDRSFDVVVAQFVITAVPKPEATLDEFARVIRPGGEIVLVNHIGAEAGPRRAFEICFAPIARRLGWRPEFRFGRLADWAAAPRRRAIDRAPANAAARPFFTDPLRAPGRHDELSGTLAPAKPLSARFVSIRAERKRAMARGIRVLEFDGFGNPAADRGRRSGSAADKSASGAQDRTARSECLRAFGYASHDREGRGSRPADSTTRQGNLSDKLARSGGVICPPNMSIRRSNSRPRRVALCL